MFLDVGSNIIVATFSGWIFKLNRDDTLAGDILVWQCSV